MWNLCLMLAMLASGIQCAPQPDFRVVSPVIFREREHAIPYETTAKIIFKVPLPIHNARSPINCSHSDALCRAKITLYEVYNWNSEMIQTLAEKPTREQRQIGIMAAAAGGYFLSSMISKFSTKLFGSEADVTNEIQKIRNAMTHNNKEFLLFEASVQKFATEMISTVTSIKKKEDDILVVLNVLSVISLIQNEFRNIEVGLQACINGYLPFTLIEAEVLRRALHNVSDRVAPMGLRLTVSTRAIEEYYKLEIADCLVTKSSITIMANIPLVTQNWKIVDVIPIPFSYENHTCALATPQTMRMATGKTTVVFDNYFSQFCDTVNGHLCFVPSLLRSSGRLNNCIKSMHRGIRSDSTLRKCPMDCEFENHPRIFEVTPAKIVATNVKSVHVECPHHVQEYTTDNTGAFEVTIRCHCTYIIGPYNISSHLACSTGEHVFNDVVCIIPDAWTVVEYSPEHLFKSTMKSAVLYQNLSIDLPIEKSDLQVPFFSYNFDLTGIQLITLTIFCIFLLIALVVLARSHRKLVSL